MKSALAMTLVARCGIEECVYNRNGKCHARAINVGGNGIHPTCETYIEGDRHTEARNVAGVGACKVTDCEFNEDFACLARTIEIDRGIGSADCLTFERRA